MLENYVGQKLGNYTLSSIVGRGAFADVYLGEHIYLKTQAAIKVLRMHLDSDKLQSFLNEARTVAHLIHPHIIRVLEFGVEEHIPFLVMDYAPHGSLRQRYPTGTPIPVQTVVSYVRQIATALQYAHDRKLIHRDIKPENMLLGSNDEVLLTDFGLAQVVHSSDEQKVQKTAGTLPYMAPEQLRGKPRPATDQYALGIIVYEWLSGSPPFQGAFTEVAMQHMVAIPPPLHEKIPTIPATVEHVVLRALEKEPQLRFPNVQMFARALEQACATDFAQQPISQSQSHHVSFSTEATPSIKRLLEDTPPSQEPPADSNHRLMTKSTIQSPNTRQSRKVTRRTALLGLAGIGGLAMLSGGAALLTQLLHNQQYPQTPHTSVTPTQGSLVSSTQEPLSTPTQGQPHTPNPTPTPSVTPTQTLTQTPTQQATSAPHPTSTATIPPSTIVSSGSGILHASHSFNFDLGSETSGDVFWEQKSNGDRFMMPTGNALLADMGHVNFNTVTLTQLHTMSYATTPLNGSNNLSNQLTTNNVFAVVTNSGNHAKVQVVTYGYNLQIQWVTYRG